MKSYKSSELLVKKYEKQSNLNNNLNSQIIKSKINEKKSKVDHY